MKSIFRVCSTDYDDISVFVAGLSVVLVLVAAAFGMAASSWQLRMYMSIALMLFDLFFVAEFAFRLTSWHSPAGRTGSFKNYDLVILALSSVVPFILVSGPFLIGWALADFSAAAVRGYWSTPSPVAALGTVAALRLLRPLRFFRPGFVGLKLEKGGYALSIASSLVLVFSFAIALDGLVLPGYRSILIDQRSKVSQQFRELGPAEAVTSAAVVSDLEALVHRQQLVYRRDTAAKLQPGEYEYYGDADTGVWFSMRKWQTARSVVEMLSAMLALWIPVSILISQKARRKRYTTQQADPGIGKNRNLPVGREELQGILGK